LGIDGAEPVSLGAGIEDGELILDSASTVIEETTQGVSCNSHIPHVRVQGEEPVVERPFEKSMAPPAHGTTAEDDYSVTESDAGDGADCMDGVESPWAGSIALLHVWVQEGRDIR
jgi:hypothetical protein